ncbi:unnamed protein product [Arabis nemorensis]|uniref:Uncharacterized protein n=1 Tax=Arabis nemorensis TaxID=586526 RepID=A0A565AXV9_9BRAS|nr:unnamed protein product [Arabis nemorensis]
MISEDEQIAPLPAKVQLKSNWDDEDVDENEIKDSWKDDDEPALPPPVKPAPEKTPKKAASKTVEKKGKAAEVPKETPKEEHVDPIAEKLRQQRLVEEADYRATAELFGAKDEEKSLDMFIPKSESDFLEYAEMISHRLKPYEVCRILSFFFHGLKPYAHGMLDVKDVASSITAIANEKLKAEKEAAAGKKKTGGKKKQLLLDKPDDDLVAGPYDAMDDFDFM